jgi:hypothetical protein
MSDLKHTDKCTTCDAETISRNGKIICFVCTDMNIGGKCIICGYIHQYVTNKYVCYICFPLIYMFNYDQCYCDQCIKKK